MCGIVGIVSEKSCVNEVVKGLHSLEYRGYDSEGIAILTNNKINKFFFNEYYFFSFHTHHVFIYIF